jgi:uncharacterized membrane protein YbhN (UPF0104 family)
MAAQKFKNLLKLIIKLVVTGLCLWYVSNKINWNETIDLFYTANKGWLLLAVLFFATSKIVSAFRLNYYFKSIDVHLDEYSNLRLYWLGMFYNLFLPGGIGGDAYKVILLNQNYNHPLKPLSAAVLLDRLSGIIGLLILAAGFYFLISATTIATLGVIAIIPGIVIFYFLMKWIFPSFIKVFTPTLLLGLLVQVLQVLCVYCIMLSINIPLTVHAYIFIFLISSVVAILPFTIGGLGAREIVFLWGSQQFGLDKHQSVYISLLFYLVTVFISAIGAVWVFTTPIKKTTP